MDNLSKLFLKLCVQFLPAKHKFLLYRPSCLIVSVMMALAFLVLVVVVITAAPPALAEPPGSSISSENSGGTGG